MSDRRVLGWDVGGANVKAAWAEGRRLRVTARPFALWRDPRKLRGVLEAMAAELGAADVVGVTMTAEIADCFPTKAEGVNFVLAALATAFPDMPLHVFATDGRFRSPAEARRAPIEVASANWMAAAQLVAREERDAILIDVGTTTTDVIPIVGGAVAACGWTDPERLSRGELVYTGAVRTPVCAIARTVPLRGRRYRVAAELFAQAGDLHLLLGHLSERDYVGDTPDGRGKAPAEARARLARMICADAAMLSDAEIADLVRYLAERQVRQIAAAVREVRARLGRSAPGRAVTLGLGSFLARAAAQRAGLELRNWGDSVGEEASRAAPAVAVARLLQEIAP